MHYRVLYWIIAMLSVSLVAAAPAVIDPQSVTFTSTAIDMNGYLTQPNTPVPVTMSFTVNEPYTDIDVDISAFTGRDDLPVQVSTATCGRTCTVQFVMNIANSGTNTYKDVPYTITAVNGDVQKLTHRFKLDSIRPKVLSIGTAYCAKNCALKSGQNTIVATFSEQGSGMKKENAFLTAPSSTRATWCNATTCNFTITVGAASELQVKLADTTADAAGNKVDGVLEATFAIDNVDPVITEIQAKGRGTNPTPIMTGPFELRVLVEDLSPLIAIIDVTNITVNKTATPDKTDIRTVHCVNGVCTTQVNPLAGSRTDDITVRVTDAAGNTDTEGKRIQIAVAETTIEGDFWDATQPVLQPRGLDRATLVHFPKTLYLQTTLVPNDAVSIAYVQVKRCSIMRQSATDEEISMSIPMDAPRMQGETTANPVIAVTLKPTNAFAAIDGTVDVVCELDIYTQKNGVLYEKSETQEVRGHITLVSNPLISDQIAQERERVKNKTEEGRRHLQTYKNLYLLGATLCPGTAGLAGSEIATAVSQLQFASVPPLDPAASAMRTAGGEIDKAKRAISDSPYGEQFCKALTCQYAAGLNQKVFNNNQLYGSVANQISQYTTGSEQAYFLDPYRSYPVAAASFCIPAIVQHVERWQSIQCNYNACLQTQTTVGIPVSACAAEKDNLECRYLAAGVFYTSPAGVMQVVRDHALSILSNPLSAASYAAVAACHKIPPNTLNAICRLPHHVADFNEKLGVANTVVSVASQTVAGIQGSSSDQSACGQADQAIYNFQQSIAGQGACSANTARFGNFLYVGGQYYRIDQRTETTDFNADNLEEQAELVTGHKLTPVISAKERTRQNQNTPTISAEAKTQLDAIAKQCGVTGTTTILNGEANDKFSTELKQAQDAITAQNGRLDYANSLYGYTQGLRTDPRTTISYGSELERRPGEREIDWFARMETTTIAPYNIAAADYVKTLREQLGAQVPQDDRAKALTATAQQELATLETKLRKADPASVNEVLSESPALRAAGRAAQRQQAVEQRALREEQKKHERILRNEVYAQERNKMQESFGYTLTQAAKTATGVTQATQRLTQLTSSLGWFSMPQWVRGYSDKIDQTGIGKATDFEEQFLDRVCRGDIRREPNIIGLDDSDHIGMYLQGVVTTTQTVDEETEMETPHYEYAIGGYIRLPATFEEVPVEQVTYNIYLEQPGTSDFLDEGVISGGGTHSWRAPDWLSFESEVQYEKVCIKFSTPIEDLYNTHYRGDVVCVPLHELEVTE
jgi:hypothetical protein